MKRQLRPLVLFACMAAATAFGSQLAAADTGAGHDGSRANCGEQHQGFHKGGFLKRLAKQLGLSEQQKTGAKAILKNSRADNKPLVTALMTERHQMRSLMLSGTADEAAIRAQSAKIAAIQADLAVKRAQEVKQLLALLTPEQTTKLRAILDKHEQKLRKRMSDKEGPMM